MTIHTHAAMNLDTYEVITTNHVNHLRRLVEKRASWDVAHGYGRGRWVFAHGVDWGSKLAAKLASY